MLDMTGKLIKTTEGKEYMLEKIVAQGAQGTVYQESSGDFMIKLYDSSNEMHVRKLIEKFQWLKKQSYPDRFIMPLEVIEKPYAGYVMKRVKGHFSLNKLLIRPKEIKFAAWYNDLSGGLRRRLYLGFLIAQSFHTLHKDNRAYCDISGNNVLVAEDKTKASVCMIDIDNVYVPGTDRTSILGTARYMAPEIMNKQMQPDILTDDYSLAVLLFELLRAGHPYLGDMVTGGSPEMENDAYKGLYPYVDDDEHTFNSSSKMLPHEAVFSSKLKELFKKTFVDGKTNRMSRATSYELALACLEASNLLIKCNECDAWYLPVQKVGEAYTCPWCENSNDAPRYLSFRDSYAMYDKSTLKKELKFKAVSSFLLRKSICSITNNYIFRNNDEMKVREYFRIAYGQDKKYYLLNPNGHEMYYKKYGSKGKAIEIGTVEKQELNRGDIIFFCNPTWYENSEYTDGIDKMKLLRFAVML